MINNPSSLGTKPFAMELQYNAPNVSGATAQYSGNISAVKWRHNGGSEQSYRYNYGSNNEQGITCDSNGNITALTRTGIQPAAMTYNYSGNRLSSIVKGGTTYTYAHDSNGNVTTDGIRGMTITYNYLNLPKSVAKGTDNLEFIYDATGVRLATKQNGTTQNYYTGAVVYKSDKTPDYILTSSGMIRKDGANYIRQYNITDHLGNVRSVVSQLFFNLYLEIKILFCERYNLLFCRIPACREQQFFIKIFVNKRNRFTPTLRFYRNSLIFVYP